MAVSRLKTWIIEVLTASDLNAEFNNILNNGEDLGWPATKAKDLNGQQLILDADADSHFTADTDDRLDLALAGTDLFRFDGTVATPVNGFDFVAAAAGSEPSLTAVGADTDISVLLTPKGAGDAQVVSGNLTLPTHSAFLAFNTSQDADVTGNSTETTADFDSEVYDQGADYASDTFTAPVTGRYLLATSCQMSGLTSAADLARLRINTSNRIYVASWDRTNNMPSLMNMALSTIADMDASDTATVSIQVNGEASDVVDLDGNGTTLQTYFSGCLLA